MEADIAICASMLHLLGTECGIRQSCNMPDYTDNSTVNILTKQSPAGTGSERPMVPKFAPASTVK